MKRRCPLRFLHFISKMMGLGFKERADVSLSGSALPKMEAPEHLAHSEHAAQFKRNIL